MLYGRCYRSAHLNTWGCLDAQPSLQVFENWGSVGLPQLQIPEGMLGDLGSLLVAFSPQAPAGRVATGSQEPKLIGHLQGDMKPT